MPWRGLGSGKVPLAVLTAAGFLSGVFLIHPTAAVAMSAGGDVTATILASYGPDGWGLLAYHAALGGLLGALLGGLALRLYQRRLAEEERARELERRLLQSQKMETVGRLAGGIAHDFNNLLSILSLNLYLAKEETPADSEAQKFIAEASSVVERAANLPRQLLMFSRKSPADAAVVEVDAVVAGVGTLCRRMLPASIHFETTLGAGWRTRIDPGQLEQLILNLAVNARDAMPAGGSLTIRTRRVTLPGPGFPVDLPAGAYTEISVKDTGTGMPPEIRERIFEPFFTTKETGKGTGLGLSICYGIAEAAGGRITVDSVEGAGSIFRVFLPQTEAPAPERRLETPALSRGRGTVLVVDDEPQVREATRAVLERAGYVVHTASDGEDALAAARRLPRLDLVLADIVMPRMDGNTLAQRLGAERPGLRVLLMTGYAEGSDGAPLEGVLHKPVRPDELADAVRQALAPAP